MTTSFIGRCSSRLVILLYVGKCEGRKWGVQAEIVLHLLEYISEGKTGNGAGCNEYF
jgi:hypothetical protein